jgi:hypothetical protein
MTQDVMKKRVKEQLAKMGYSKEADLLIAKYWNQVSCYSTARKKAEYMIS